MSKKDKRIDPAQFFEKHLHYEVFMLRATMAHLTDGSHGPVLDNALIESFCVHARNLIEFFRYKDSCDIHPKVFVDNAFKKNTRFIDDGLFIMIHEQISHLTHYRTTDPEKKINSDTRARIFEQLQKEITRFERHLTSNYKTQWKMTTDYVVSTHVGPSATNRTTSASSQGGRSD